MKCIAWWLMTALALLGQGSRQQPERVRQAIQLDVEGKYVDARQLLAAEIAEAATPLAKAQAERVMALSYAFERNCAKAIEYEEKVIAYWVTREKEEPRNAYYQQGEMANEAARICIDAGDLAQAERWYAKGTELGLREPDISADRRALWEFRLEHAKARVAARRGQREVALRHVAAAEAALGRMTELKAQQTPFFPYLLGYVELYLGNAAKALEHLGQANQNDLFIVALKAEALEKLGRHVEAQELWKKAAAGRGHNPPAAYAIPLGKKKAG